MDIFATHADITSDYIHSFIMDVLGIYTILPEVKP